MNLIDNNEKVDNAWKLLYNRLEKDGLLDEENPADVRKGNKFLYKWAAILIVICICSAIVVMLNTSDSGRGGMLILVNNESSSNLVTTLEDGSVVYLTGNSSISYPENFSTEKREIMLHGEAFFDVNTQPDRPFIIEAGQVQIEVLGTAFNVKNGSDDKFSLSVLRGKVRVVSKIDNHSVIVESGQEAAFDNNRLQKFSRNNKTQFSTYAVNLHFKDEKLSDIINILNQTSDSLSIVLAPGLENRLLTVSFNDEPIYTKAELIGLALNLQCSREADTIMLSDSN